MPKKLKTLLEEMITFAKPEVYTTANGISVATANGISESPNYPLRIEIKNGIATLTGIMMLSTNLNPTMALIDIGGTGYGFERLQYCFAYKHQSATAFGLCRITLTDDPRLFTDNNYIWQAGSYIFNNARLRVNKIGGGTA